MLTDHTSKFLLQGPTSSLFSELLAAPPRLLAISGKGGVGKTSIAKGLSKALMSRGHEVHFCSLFSKGIQEEGFNYFETSPLTSTRLYLEKKLHSKLIAAGIVRTPFFKSVFPMVPGLGHITILGHILSFLDENPDVTLVLDAPASGHFQSILAAPKIFSDIFRSGMLSSDLQKMRDKLAAPSFMKMLLVALPTSMALEEGQELRQSMHSLDSRIPCYLIGNQWLTGRGESEDELQSAPLFIQEKFKQESDLLKDYQKALDAIVPFQSVEDDGLSLKLADFIEEVSL